MDISIHSLKVLSSITTGLIVAWFGGLDGSFILLLILMGTDVFTGLMKAWYQKELNPDKMFFGSMKKMTVFIVIMIATQIVRYIGSEIPLREITIIYYIIQEGMSVLENISVFNSVPDELSEFFEKINNKKGS